MIVRFKRKILTEMMTTFEAALSVNLTTMLVTTAIFISKMEGLFPTSDIKMIDIWLILCQLAPFPSFPVVLLTAIQYVREEEATDRLTWRVESWDILRCTQWSVVTYLVRLVSGAS